MFSEGGESGPDKSEVNKTKGTPDGDPGGFHSTQTNTLRILKDGKVLGRGVTQTEGEGGVVTDLAGFESELPTHDKTTDVREQTSDQRGGSNLPIDRVQKQPDF